MFEAVVHGAIALEFVFTASIGEDAAGLGRYVGVLGQFELGPTEVSHGLALGSLKEVAGDVCGSVGFSNPVVGEMSFGDHVEP